MDHKGRTYQIATRKDADRYISPDEWAARTSSHDGSWWPEWQEWLAKQSGEKTKPPATGAPGKGYPVLRAAPGEYVSMK